MKHDEFKNLLGDVNEIQVVVVNSSFKIYVPEINKEIYLSPEEVIRWSYILDPFGHKALLLLIHKSAYEEYKLIIDPKDLVFEPVKSSESLGLAQFISCNVREMPPMIGYSEIVRDFTNIKNAINATNRFDDILGSIILLRYYLNGAERVGIDCQELNQYWQSMVEASSLDRIFNTSVTDEKQ